MGTKFLNKSYIWTVNFYYIQLKIIINIIIIIITSIIISSSSSYFL